MALNDIVQFPSQRKTWKQKGIKWRKQCVDWGEHKTFEHYSPVRKSVRTKKINLDLINGRLHMSDLQLWLNPSNIKSSYIPENIQHFPIINNKLEVLRGEESRRTFDWKVIITNPNSVSSIENRKKEELIQRLQTLIANESISEEDFNQELDNISYFFNYEWQDMRETRANALLTHYIKEYNIPLIFSQGFMDAMIFGEEIYQIDIAGGEPIIEKLNPLKVRVFRSGYSNKIEDADMVILEDYWSPGKILDRYYDRLTSADIKYLEELVLKDTTVDSAGNYDDRAGFIRADNIVDGCENEFWTDLFDGDGSINSEFMPYDTLGNIKVTRVYWKSFRKVKKIKRYNPTTGEVMYVLMPEDYILNETNGEEESIYWVNEAWEGTKIGEKIYVNMVPRVVQYNRMSNPSRCHFGIIGSIYNLNDEKPFSLVDRMKPYSYYYDAIHDRLNKLIEKNWGKIITLDLAKVPEGWSVDKWLYYAKVNNMAVINSLKEGTGVAAGRPVGAYNNAASGVIDAELGSSIQNYLTLLEFIKGEMGEIAGISKQREGQISNRETVGGVERATLQSSHSTEWLFIIHDDIKRRVFEAFLETAKIALKGRTKKFQYLLSDGQQQIMEIDGDEFAESDYGLLVDNSQELQQLNQKMESITQAAMQNGYSLSVIMKLFTATSTMEKIRAIEFEEQNQQKQKQQELQMQQQMQQEQLQQQAQTAQAELEQQERMNSENNETKILVAEINSKAEADRLALMNGDDDGVEEMSKADREKFKEQMRQFDAKLKLDRERLEFDKSKTKKDQDIKLKQINKSNKSSK